MKGEKVASWIENHLWAILAVGFGLYGGYMTGQATMETKIASLERRVLELEGLHPRASVSQARLPTGAPR